MFRLGQGPSGPSRSSSPGRGKYDGPRLRGNMTLALHRAGLEGDDMCEECRPVVQTRRGEASTRVHDKERGGTFV